MQAVVVVLPTPPLRAITAIRWHPLTGAAMRPVRSRMTSSAMPGFGRQRPPLSRKTVFCQPCAGLSGDGWSAGSAAACLALGCGVTGAPAPGNTTGRGGASAGLTGADRTTGLGATGSGSGSGLGAAGFGAGLAAGLGVGELVFSAGVAGCSAFSTVASSTTANGWVGASTDGGAFGLPSGGGVTGLAVTGAAGGGLGGTGLELTGLEGAGLEGGGAEVTGGAGVVGPGSGAVSSSNCSRSQARPWGAYS